MTSTAYDDQFAVCTPEEEEAFKAIEARQNECAPRGEISSQRERFEKLIGFFPYCMELQRYESNGDYVSLETRRAWKLWQAACPEGWQAVPKEPIEAQIDAGCEATGECERLGECHLDCDCSSAPKVYRAMLSAAPKPEDV